MAKVIFTKKLEEEINKLFKKESIKIFESMRELENNPHKGKPLGQIGGIVIKEIKYESYRFYFITDGFKLKMLQKEELNDLLIKFVRMSDKKAQQKTIDEIKYILRRLGEEGF
ncbi:MAG: type II toxin-antitoxin system RelE/ParE family toxin [Nanoarchaeota archaeon]